MLKGRYRRLPTNLEKANDHSNFTASGIEASISYQLEMAGFELDYEVKQDPGDLTSVDLRWKTGI